MRKIELLAPARDAAAARAAIDCGADAIYIGAGRFGARAAAANPVGDIAWVCDYARPFGVKVYAALNTLLFEDELDEAQRLARQVVEAGVDALIVQDMAYLRMDLGVEELGVELHASTQATITTSDRVRFLRDVGFSRVILERGLTLEQIKQIRAAVVGVELECFVHGAICVGHSGDCYLSRSMGPRSGNRGECSQPCRLTYGLENDIGEKLYAGRHLLSLQDLDLTAALPDLLDAGVTSFKIEGRLKDATYVMNTVTHYRRELDRLIASRPDLERSSYGVSSGWPGGLDADPSRSFSRGATEYYLHGKQAGAASFDTPKSVGAPVGRVAAVGRDFFTLTGVGSGADVAIAAGGAVSMATAPDGPLLSVPASSPSVPLAPGSTLPPSAVPLPGALLASPPAPSLVPGDGICFVSDGKLLGTNINRVEGRRIYPNRMEGLAAGTEVLRNFDKRFNDTLLSVAVRRQLAVIMSFIGSDMAEITLTVRDISRGARGAEATEAKNGAKSAQATATLAGPFSPAEKPVQMASMIREQLSKSGGTIFRVESVDIDIDGDIPFLKSSQINALRREALDKLAALLARPRPEAFDSSARPRPAPEQKEAHPASTRQEDSLALRREDLTASPQQNALYPPSLGPVTTATNSLARDFYTGHGATLAPVAKELMDDLAGQCVMTTPYCLRRETEQCLWDDPPYRGALYLVRGRLRYRLAFDCDNCLMNIILTESQL